MDCTSPLAERYRRDGVALGEWFGCALPESFAGPAAEYAALRESAAVVDANYLRVAELTGPDRVRYLNAVVSNDINGLADGQGAVALLLNPQGRILAELECYALPDRLLLLFHAVTGERTLQTLDKFIIMDDATLADISAPRCTFALEGPRALDALRGVSGADLASFAAYQHTEADIAGHTCRVIRRSVCGGNGVTVLGPRAQAESLWDVLAEATRQAGGGPAGYATLNAVRLEAGVPWFSHDFDDKVIPHEAALETSHISFTKGCYTGQEIVERVRSRGQVNRRRVSLVFDGAAPPAPGDKLLAGEKEVGIVTSAAISPGRNTSVGMGYLRKEHQPAGSVVQWSGRTARVAEPPLNG